MAKKISCCNLPPGSEIDRLFAAWDMADSPGCALGVIKKGRIVYARGYGIANLEHDIPISSRTVFRIASTSKQFTAMCIALLAEQGALALDDDIRKYLPEIPSYESAITIRHLVHHTSGLRDYLELMSLAGMREADHYTDDEVLALLARQQGLNFDPGDQHLYSNTGYLLLGAIVRRAGGDSLADFAKENIFAPLGMDDTHFHNDHTLIVKNRAAGYSPHENGGYRINMTTLDMVGDGGVFTTIDDLLIWDRNFYRNRLGKGNEQLIRQVLTTGTLNNGKKLDYAFGLIIRDYNGLRMIGHGGSFVGFRAEMIRFPAQEFSVICLANLSSINPSRLALQVAGIYLADQIKPKDVITVEPKRSELPEQELEEKTGLYHSPATDEILEISLEGGELIAEKSGFEFKLAPVGSLKFRAVAAPANIELQFEYHGGEKRSSVCLLIEGKEPDTLHRLETISPSLDRLASYVGDFYSDELQTTYTIVLEDGKLSVKQKNRPVDRLQPIRDDLFRANGILLRFAGDGAGTIAEFTLSAGRVRNMRFTRIDGRPVGHLSSGAGSAKLPGQPLQGE